MRRMFYLLILGIVFQYNAIGQCDSLVIDIVDEFDSTRLISSQTVNIGYMVPSKFETIDGFKLVEEGKVMITFTQNDTLNAFFMTLAVQEREFQKISSAKNVFLALTNDSIVGLLNFPDKGVFDRTTNMRRFQHYCVVPYDQLFNLSYNGIKKIRIQYDGGYKHDIVIIPKQQELIKEQILCIAKRLNMLPIKP